jgi:DNA-binding NarL/FixJ family response regulator
MTDSAADAARSSTGPVPAHDAGRSRIPGEIRILLADDHQLLRQGLRALFESEPGFRLVGEAGDGLDVLRQVDALGPDVLVLDLMMPGLNGLEVTRQLHQRRSRTRVVILSMYADEPYVLEALRHGAAAYVLKSSPMRELVHAVREAVAGRRFLSPPLSEEDLERLGRQSGDGRFDPWETLTTREREVFLLAAQGLNGPEIAERLCVGRRTVETHRASFMRKLGLRGQTQVVQFAMRRGFLPES